MCHTYMGLLDSGLVALALAVALYNDVGTDLPHCSVVPTCASCVLVLKLALLDSGPQQMW